MEGFVSKIITEEHEHLGCRKLCLSLFGTAKLLSRDDKAVNLTNWQKKIDGNCSIFGRECSSLLQAGKDPQRQESLCNIYFVTQNAKLCFCVMRIDLL